MVEYFLRTRAEEEIVRLMRPRRGCWIDMVNPSKAQIRRIRRLLAVPLDFFQAGLDEDEKPRIEVEGGAVLVIVRFPHREVTVPLAVIITPEYVTTVCRVKSAVVKRLLRKKDLYTNKRTRFLLQVFEVVSRLFVESLDLIEAKMKELEAKLLARSQSQDILGLLDLQKMLVYLNTAVVANGNVLERVLRGKIVPLYESDTDLLEDIILENKQSIEMVGLFSKLLGKTMDFYTTVVSNNLNVIMKFLTSVTIILTVPTIIGSIWGMNIALPFQHSPFAFLILTGGSLLISLILVVVFLRKGWF